MSWHSNTWLHVFFVLYCAPFLWIIQAVKRMVQIVMKLLAASQYDILAGPIWHNEYTRLSTHFWQRKSHRDVFWVSGYIEDIWDSYEAGSRIFGLGPNTIWTIIILQKYWTGWIWAKQSDAVYPHLCQCPCAKTFLVYETNQLADQYLWASDTPISIIPGIFGYFNFSSVFLGPQKITLFDSNRHSSVELLLALEPGLRIGSCTLTV